MAREEVEEVHYDDDKEELYIQFLISNNDLLVRCLTILDPELFHNPINSRVVEFIKSYVNEYSILPTLEQIYAETKKRLEVLDEGTIAKHEVWFLGEFEQFTRHRSLERAILSSPDLLMDGRYGEVETNVKTAVQVGLVKDLGTDYFANPQERLEGIRDNSKMVSTGWRDVDKKLYGGFNRGEITIFAGQSGSGKSLFLQNLAINWANNGLNVVYITLELSESLTAMRMDAMVTGYATYDVMKNIDEVSLRVCASQKKHKGQLRLKQLPSGATANDVRSYVREYEIQSGKKVDAILVDYLDLMMPVGVKVNPSDQFIKDKFVSEELRNLAVELDALMISASQLNRGSYEEIEFDPSHIAGGISKVNTADNVIGIFTSISMKEAGRYQIQFMKTRSSAGVGSKVDLSFDPKTLRIGDLDEDDEGAVAAQTKNIMETLRQKSTVVDSTGAVAVPKVPQNTADKVTSLRDLISKMD